MIVVQTVETTGHTASLRQQVTLQWEKQRSCRLKKIRETCQSITVLGLNLDCDSSKLKSKKE